MAKDRAGALLFDSWPNYLLAKFGEIYSIERLDVGLVNEGSTPKYMGRVYKMANNSCYLLDDSRTLMNIGKMKYSFLIFTLGFDIVFVHFVHYL